MTQLTQPSCTPLTKCILSLSNSGVMSDKNLGGPSRLELGRLIVEQWPRKLVLHVGFFFHVNFTSAGFELESQRNPRSCHDVQKSGAQYFAV